MIIGMKCQNEQYTVDRCISDFHDEPFVDKIVVVDGGSTDYTVQELKKYNKVQVFVHPWLDWYHNAEVCQSNIVLSYIPNGALMFILDFDERISDELKQALSKIKDLPDGHVRSFSRKTVDVFRHDDSPHAIIGEDGWPVISNQIGQYPDFQCRLLKKDFKMHWVNSPHHVLMGYICNENIVADIIHYEKDDFRKRQDIERKWLRAQARRKELGLTADIFECDPKKELIKYGDPETWKQL
jgi:glycosyltransferase involved in cell wall biosynthesis